MSGAARPARRAALRALAGAGALASTLAACGRAPGEGASGRATDPAPLLGPEAASPLSHAPAVALLPDMGDGATRGWVTGGSAPVAFIFDPGADAQTGAPPIIFIGGDRKGWGAGAMTPLWRAQARGALAVAAGGAPRATLLTLGRPYAGDPSRWRTRAEIDALAHAIAELGRAIGFGRADVLGHSSGGHLAVALAQETARVRFLGAAAPPLDLIAWHETWLRQASRAVRRQYDPIARVGALTLDGAIIVADPLDEVMPPRAWRAWLAQARAMGKPVALVLAAGRGPDRHGLVGPAAAALSALRASA